MIEFLRIDDRLLHGQVVQKWVMAIGPDAIVVANDEVMTNEIAKLALKMAKPEGMKLAIKSVKDSIALINNPKTANMRLFVVTKNSGDARKIVEETENVNVVNIGGMSNKKEGGKMIRSSVHVDDKDVENIKYMYGKAKEIDVRVVPTNSKKDFLKCI